MVVQSQPKTYTLDEYRALEETAEHRSEYHNGEISPMIGGAINHNRIVRNLLRMLDISCSVASAPHGGQKIHQLGKGDNGD